MAVFSLTATPTTLGAALGFAPNSGKSGQYRGLVVALNDGASTETLGLSIQAVPATLADVTTYEFQFSCDPAANLRSDAELSYDGNIFTTYLVASGALGQVGITPLYK